MLMIVVNDDYEFECLVAVNANALLQVVHEWLLLLLIIINGCC